MLVPSFIFTVGFGAGINMTIGAGLSPNVGRAKFLSIWSMFSQVSVVAGPLAVSSIMLISSLLVAFTVIGSSALGARPIHARPSQSAFSGSSLPKPLNWTHDLFPPRRCPPFLS